jgi:hypothetical protein
MITDLKQRSPCSHWIVRLALVIGIEELFEPLDELEVVLKQTAVSGV